MGVTNATDIVGTICQRSISPQSYFFLSREANESSKPWPHQDQDPAKPGFRCTFSLSSTLLTQTGLQGLVNLNPCGPTDGGLIVCPGGHTISEQFHREMANEPRIPAWTPEWFGFTEKGMKWLADHGMEWKKVCADPGDLIVWDSRVPHYNLPPEGKQDRLAVYACFMPVNEASQEDLVRKGKAFDGISPPPPHSVQSCGSLANWTRPSWNHALA